jgi:hypothetical protein
VSAGWTWRWQRACASGRAPWLLGAVLIFAVHDFDYRTTRSRPARATAAIHSGCDPKQL